METGLFALLFGLFGATAGIGIAGAVVGYGTKVKDAPITFFASLGVGLVAGILLSFQLT